MSLATAQDPSPAHRARRSPFDRILAEYGVVVLPLAATRTKPRQTHAGKKLARLLGEHGEAHLRDVLTLLLESEGNEHALVAPIITATSSLLLAHPRWWEGDASGWLDTFDRVDLLALYGELHANRNAVPLAEAIATVLFQALPATGRPPVRVDWLRDIAKLREDRAAAPAAAPDPALLERYELSDKMVDTLRRAQRDEAGAMRLPAFANALCIRALRRRGLVDAGDSLRLTDAGSAAAAEVKGA